MIQYTEQETYQVALDGLGHLAEKRLLTGGMLRKERLVDALEYVTAPCAAGAAGLCVLFPEGVDLDEITRVDSVWVKFNNVSEGNDTFVRNGESCKFNPHAINKIINANDSFQGSPEARWTYMKQWLQERI